MEDKITTRNLSKKQINTARLAYRKSKRHRSYGFVFWLFCALVWLGFGYLAYSIGEISGTEDPVGAFNAIFGVPVVLLLVLFFYGNSRSIKKHKALKAKAAAMDPALIELFELELVQEQKEAEARELDRENQKIQDAIIKKEVAEQQYEEAKKRWEKDKEMIDF